MSEGQRLEWKSAWRDDHLKSLCAFANADGGTMEVGRDDDGSIVGVGARDRRRLLEEIPNKLRDLLGIVASLEVPEEDGVPFLRIAVEPYPVAISYRGVYYQRSGSTDQPLKGPALDRFLLGKAGRRWDGMPDPRVSLADLDPAALADFRRRAAIAGRLSDDALKVGDARLVEMLRLTDGDYLTKAAILLFHAEPEFFVPAAHIKLGYFLDDSELRFHDRCSGGLLRQVDQAMEVLLFKYLRARIQYEGRQRVESYPMPRVALREAILNAVVHRDYAVPRDIQIRVHDDRLQIDNPGALPDGWTLDRLLGPHPSQPHNPDIANAFFWAGEIETWGLGISRVLKACRRAGTPEPRIRVESEGISFEFPFSDDYMESVLLGPRSGGGSRSGKPRDPTAADSPPGDGNATKARSGARGRLRSLRTALGKAVLGRRSR